MLCFLSGGKIWWNQVRWSMSG